MADSSLWYGGSWVQRIGKCIRVFGRHGRESVDNIHKLLEEDLKGMLMSAA